MPSIGPRCGELRFQDQGHNWRVVYRVDDDAILIIHVFAKTTRKTPQKVIDLCQKRLANYDAAKAAAIKEFAEKAARSSEQQGRK